MADQRPLTNEEGEVRELTAADLAQFVSFSELPAELQRKLSSEKRVSADAEPPVSKEPAA